MRLLRLTTEDENAIFNATFNEDLVLKKDSQIALQNISIEAETDILIVDSQNENIIYENSNAGEQTITLINGSYTGLNFEDLLNDIKNKLNGNTGYLESLANNRELGMEWNCFVNRQTKVTIEYKLGEISEFAEFWEKDDDLVQRVTTAGGLWSKKQGIVASNDYESNMYYPFFIARGCGFTRGKIYTLENASGGIEETQGFILGLSNTQIGEPSGLEPGNISYGLRCSIDAGGTRSYKWIENGVETDSVVPVGYSGDGHTNNDFIEIEINKGKINANCYKVGSDTATLIKQWDYTAGTELYPVNVFFGIRSEARLSNVKVSDSPYNTNDTIRGNNPQEVELHAPPRPSRAVAPNFIKFGNIEFANFLGYNFQRYPSSGTDTAQEVSYIANKSTSLKVVADAFLIELLNIPLDSYDSFVNQRKNILAVVPKSDREGVIIYEPSTPFFIDIKNQNDILIRNIRARVVKPDYSPFEMRGLATMTILIS